MMLSDVVLIFYLLFLIVPPLTLITFKHRLCKYRPSETGAAANPWRHPSPVQVMLLSV
jgi:hypothetical protein